MHCERCQDLIGAYRDGELPPDERQAVAAHLETCRSCSEVLADDERIGRALRLRGRTPAPAGLAARIHTSLQRIDAGSLPLVTTVDAAQPSASRWSAGALANQAAAIAAACLMSIGITWWAMSALPRTNQVEREILSAHVRSLLQDTPVQVASSDQHTVRPWFAGRVDFAPAVKDLKAEGFPLLGGRLDYIAERRVGALVYKRNLHIINVFLWPAANSADTTPVTSARNGYNLASWSRSGVTYWAISDLNSDELLELQRLL